MYHFFIRFGQHLLTLTIVIVFTFQGYWLWNTFQSKKKELLEQTKVEMQQTVFSKFIDELSKNPSTKDAFHKEKEVNLKETYKTGKNTVLVLESDDSKNTEQTKKEVLPDLKLDSVLYSSIRKSLPVLFKYGDIVVYYKIKNKVTSYPAGQTFDTKNTTEEVNKLSSDKSTYRIHIKNLFVTTIYSILGPILFSVFYMILFLGTLFIIYRNLLLNQKLLKNKEVFTRNMTHELKIPLSTILIAAQGLEKYNITNEPETAKKYAQIIQRASNQLSSLVESILQNARANEYVETLEINSVNLLSLLQDVQSSLSLIIAQKQAEVIVENSTKDLNVKGNYEQLKLILLNLIDNSLKYSDMQPIVMISALRKNNRIVINVEDNGIGIPRKYEKEIFDPYFRITNDDLHDVKGFGLGLSFVKSSLKNQDGTICLVHTGKKGTTMQINLPCYE